MKSFVAILIISAFAYQAIAQTVSCTTANTNCAACSSTASAQISSTVATNANVSNLCLGCASGFLLAPNTACTLITNTGCLWGPTATTCYPGGCMAGYVYLASVLGCVSCTIPTAGATTGVTGQAAGILTCTITSAGVITAASCAANYFNNSGSCLSCQVVGTATTTTLLTGIAYCSTCTATAITGAGTSNTFVTCTACVWGYTLYPATTTSTSTAGTGPGSAPVTVPFCFNTASGQALTATATNIPLLSSSVATGAVIVVTAIPGCATAAIVLPSTASQTTFNSVTCIAPLAGYFCSAYLTYASTCTNTAASFPTAMPAGSASGYSTVVAVIATTTSATGLTIYSCSSLYQFIPTTATVPQGPGSCVLTLTGCATMSATTCLVASAGYNVAVGGGTPVACNTTSTVCSGGPSSGSILYANGSMVTATGVTNCWLSNSTSNCLLCAAGYATAVPTCTTACGSNCNVCTSTTACTVCKTGFTAGTSGTCTATASTSNSNVLFSGLAFVSMIFYYIF